MPLDEVNDVSRLFRIDLRTLLLVVLLIFVVTVFPVVLIFVAFLAPLTGPAIGLSSAVIVWEMRSLHKANRWPSVGGWISVCLVLLPVLTCWFIRHRWVNAIGDHDWPRPFPYPDVLLLEVHDWWDRLHPAGPGDLKVDGEFYAVLLGTNILFVVACIVCGAVCG